MIKKFGKPAIEMQTMDVHFTLELETKEQVDFVIDQLKIVRKELPKEEVKGNHQVSRR